MKKIAIFAISPLKGNSLLEQSVQNYDFIDLNITYNNTSVGLSKFYNNILDTYSGESDVVIFCHHDISLAYCNLQEQVYEGLKKFDIIGVAGGLEPQIIEKNLWHWMVPKEKYRGFAAHPYEGNNLYITSFGPSPSRVAVLDGVFLAFEIKKLQKNKHVRFDENFMWHHYDIDFCLTCNENKIKLGVWPILLNHVSPGLRDINQTEWNRSNAYFKEKWTKRLNEVAR